MSNVKIKGFDSNKMLRQITKDFEKDLKKPPEMLLDFHIGDIVEGNCSKCGNTTIEILTKGKAKCTKCGLITKVNVEINYK